MIAAVVLCCAVHSASAEPPAPAGRSVDTSPISAGFGFGFPELLQLDASYWINEYVSVDMRIFFSVVALGATPAISAHLPIEPGRRRFTLFGQAGAIAAIAAVDSTNSDDHTIVWPFAAAGIGYLGTRFDLRFAVGAAAEPGLLAGRDAAKAPVVTIAIMWRQ